MLSQTNQYLSVLRQAAGLTLMSQTLMDDWDTVKTMRVVGQYLTFSTVLGWPPSDCNSFPVTRSHTLVVRSAAQVYRETMLTTVPHFKDKIQPVHVLDRKSDAKFLDPNQPRVYCFMKTILSFSLARSHTHTHTNTNSPLHTHTLS